MSELFTPIKIGPVEIKNRFEHAPTCESMAGANGEVTDELIKRYERIARGEVGLIVTGITVVHPLGRVPGRAIQIDRDDLIPGWQRLADVVHKEGSKLFIQFLHAGAQTAKRATGSTPMGPSGFIFNLAYLNFCRAMTEGEIGEAIQAYGQAARRAAEAGVDGVNIAASGGYLLNEFLSPFFNHRKDKWGGSDENRFRLLKEVVQEVRRNVLPTMAVTVKLTANDYTPLPGLKTTLATKYAGWLADLGIDGLEIASGNTTYSGFHIWRGDVPIKELLPGFPAWQRPMGWALMKFWDGRYDCYEGYNLMDAYSIKQAIGDIPFTLVGGLRHLSFMEEMIEKGPADIIGLCRPLIREPNLVKKFQEGKAEVSTCVSCNKCFADVVLEQPVRCHKQN